MFNNTDLFSKQVFHANPLAVRVRPKKLEDIVGQEHLIGKGKPLNVLIETKKLFSVILYGPPGCGKTTIAKIIGEKLNAHFISINAVLSNIEELRKIIKIAEENLKLKNKNTILFIDEIHRFNKAQQEALLSSIETHILILIGATALNPFFHLSKALLSRTNVFELKKINKFDIEKILIRALETDEYIKKMNIKVSKKIFNKIIERSNCDARKALNLLEFCLNSAMALNKKQIDKEILENLDSFKNFEYERIEDHYEIISAFIKSIRGSDADAAIYYLARMLESGEDPRFIARRLVILASEDVGLADTNALNIAVSAAQAVELVGLPEAKLNLAHATIYLATAPKSNSSYMAIKKAESDIKNGLLLKIPSHLINISKDIHKYKYPHNYENGYVNQKYFNSDKKYYIPKNIGDEKKIIKYLEYLKKIK